MRTSFTMSKEMETQLRRLSGLWDASRAETMRRLFGVGVYFVDEIMNGSEITVKRNDKDDAVIVVFPEITGE